MSSKVNKRRDLFEDIELYDEVSEVIPFSMGAPGPIALSECNEIMMKATTKALVRTVESQSMSLVRPKFC